MSDGSTRTAVRVVLVTGGASGIGRAAALAWARQGLHVAISDVSRAGAAETARLVEAAGARAFFHLADVKDDAQCAALVRATVEHFGRLDIAFNNAGIAGPADKLMDCDPDAWREVMAVNLHGTYHCMRHEIAAMQAHGGVIVNCASIFGLRGVAGGSAYSAAKHGVIGLTRSAALEYGPRSIRVNAICPGFTDTPLVRGDTSPISASALRAKLERSALRRLARAEEVAAVALWLASDAASFVTGAAVAADGGFLAS